MNVKKVDESTEEDDHNEQKEKSDDINNNGIISDYLVELILKRKKI